MKSELIGVLIENQEQVVNDLKVDIDFRNKAGDLDEDDVILQDDTSQQEINKDYARKISDQYITAQNELEFLRSIQYVESSEFSVGALVETKDAFFVIGPAFRNGTYNDKPIYAISEDAPAYEKNAGKKVGETLTFNGRDYPVISIS